MRRSRHNVAVAVLAATFLLPFSARAAVFVVTTTADSGAGSLRQAITDANANADADTITFAVGGAGVPQVAPASNLPAITQPVVIDATTQAAGAVELTGTTTTGFALTGSDITIRGFVIN